MNKLGSKRDRVYCIFYLDKKNFGNIKSQLKEAGIKGVKPIIPIQRSQYFSIMGL